MDGQPDGYPAAMLYRLLGILVWNGAKVVLRRRYGRTYLPRPVLAGVLLAGVGAIVLLLTRRDSG
jgi:hypothetical protein